jgi:hypothetical protein
VVTIPSTGSSPVAARSRAGVCTRIAAVDALDPAAALEELAALPLEARPEMLLLLADELERRIDSAVTPPSQPGPTNLPNPLERSPGRP